MAHLPAVHDAQRSTKPTVRRYNNVKSALDRLHVAVTDPNLTLIVIFCAIGLLVTLNVISRFPDFGLSVEQLMQFLG